MAPKKKPVTKEEACIKMEGLCARSEQCESDIYRKLFNMGLSSAQCRDIIDHLRDNRFLDNLRYAKSFANDKARFSSWGPHKIKAALVMRRISSSDISQALSEVDEEIWENAIMRCAQSKARTLQLTGEEGYTDRKKLFTYLIGRGFSSSDANRAVKIMKRRQEEEES